MFGRQGKNIVSIPVPQVNLPRFRHGKNQVGGVGQGEGEVGSPVSDSQPATGAGAGDQPGDHILEVELEWKELGKMMAEELELPFIQPKGKRNLESEKGRYKGLNRVGPESLRHFKRTYKKALLRQIASGTYDFEKPRILPIKEDKRYRTRKFTPTPENSAVIIYILDISGSMGPDQMEIVRTESFWIDTWLKFNYEGLETRYIVHDAAAHETKKEVFFQVRQGGGTKISSAYQLANQIITESYPIEDWNIYVFHFSDGDNYDSNDNEICLNLLRENLLPQCNLFCYGQVRSLYGSGKFKGILENALKDVENLSLSDIENLAGIYDSIREFFGKGQ
jgi:uncharacterized sporulation protein YeaH/YhbH (DUF444 family)